MGRTYLIRVYISKMADSAVAVVSALFLFAVVGVISVLTTAVNECSYTGNM